MRAFPLGEHAEGERDYASTVRSASLHPRRRRLIVSARDRRGMGRVGGRGSGRVAVSRAARRASSGAVDRPRGFVRNEIVRLNPIALVSVISKMLLGVSRVRVSVRLIRRSERVAAARPMDAVHFKRH